VAAAVYNMVLDRGASFSRDFVCKNKDGDVVPLTLCTAVMEIYYGSWRITKTTSDLLPTPTDGTLHLRLTQSETAAFPAGSKARYQLHLTDSNDVTVDLLRGTIKANP
jgi:hypothetical protein